MKRQTLSSFLDRAAVWSGLLGTNGLGLNVPSDCCVKLAKLGVPGQHHVVAGPVIVVVREPALRKGVEEIRAQARPDPGAELLVEVHPKALSLESRIIDDPRIALDIAGTQSTWCSRLHR